LRDLVHNFGDLTIATDLGFLAGITLDLPIAT